MSRTGAPYRQVHQYAKRVSGGGAVAPPAQHAVDLALTEDQDRLAGADRPPAPPAAAVAGEMRPAHAEHRLVEVARAAAGLVDRVVGSVSSIPHGPLRCLLNEAYGSAVTAP